MQCSRHLLSPEEMKKNYTKSNGMGLKSDTFYGKNQTEFHGNICLFQDLYEYSIFIVGSYPRDIFLVYLFKRFTRISYYGVYVCVCVCA
jgi:hypothetical protein